MTKDTLPFLRRADNPSFEIETDLPERLRALQRAFRQSYGAEAEIYVRSPGRAEILGNHTDYNLGYALSCAISRSTLIAFRKRADSSFRLRSAAYPKTEGAFDLGSLKKDPTLMWPNYARGVVTELISTGHSINGADIFIESNVPSSGGVSSSAALELGIATGLIELSGVTMERLALAGLCKRAENGPLVNSPCGLLDQASVALGERGKFILLDFRPTSGAPVDSRLITVDFAAQGYSFIISVDPEVRRNLGESGYPARRRMCEDSLPILEKLLRKPVSCLREVSIGEFESCKGALVKQGSEILRRRVEHVVYENQRVLDGVMAVERGDAKRFGEIMNEAGHSALELYGLDEKTPELTCLLEAGQRSSVALGSRNMGGGFSAITLSLVPKKSISKFEAEASQVYEASFARKLEFIAFEPTAGVEVL